MSRSEIDVVADAIGRADADNRGRMPNRRRLLKMARAAIDALARLAAAKPAEDAPCFADRITEEFLRLYTPEQVGVPSGIFNALLAHSIKMMPAKPAEESPSLDDPCPHPARKGRHEVYGSASGTYCRACGAGSGYKPAEDAPQEQEPDAVAEAREAFTVAALDFMFLMGPDIPLFDGLTKPGQKYSALMTKAYRALLAAESAREKEAPMPSDYEAKARELVKRSYVYDIDAVCDITTALRAAADEARADVGRRLAPLIREAEASARREERDAILKIANATRRSGCGTWTGLIQAIRARADSEQEGGA